MRTAEDIINDYMERGYTIERLRALANGRPEPIRSQMLALLDDSDEYAEQADVETAEELQGEDILAMLDEDTLQEAEVSPEAVAIEEEIFDDSTAEDLAEISAEIQPDDKQVETTEMAETNVESLPEETVMAETDTTGEIIIEKQAGIETSEITFEEDESPVEVMAEVVGPVDRIIEELENGFLESERAENNTPDESPFTLELAELEFENISQDEFHARKESVEEIERDMLDLRVHGCGEVWPTHEQVENAEHEPDIMANLDSDFFVVFPEDVENSFESVAANKAAERSLQVIKSAMAEDPALADMANEGSRIIALNPPYAVPGLEDVNHEIAFTGDVPVNKDDSGLIQFPSDMIATYDAIISTRDAAYEKIEEAEIFNDNNTKEAAEIDTINRESAEIHGQIATLQTWMKELEDALNLKNIEIEEMSRMLNEREESLKVQAEEMERLRNTPHVNENQILETREISASLETAREELEAVRSEMVTLEREYNILSTSTVPDLMQDKDDLLAMLEEESARRSPLEHEITRSGKRMALSYTVAAAASLLMVLTLVFQWTQDETRSSTFDTRIAQLETEKKQLSASLAEAADSKENVEMQFKTRIEDLMASKTSLQNRNGKLSERIDELNKKVADLQLASGGSVAPRRPEDNRRDTMTNGGSGNHRNEFDMSAWENRAASNNVSTNNGYKTAIVRRGETVGLVINRILGTSNKRLVQWVVKNNSLTLNSYGHPIVQVGQKLKIPASTNTSSADASNGIINFR